MTGVQTCALPILLGASEAVADQCPVDEILAAVERQAGEVLEARAHEVVVAPHAAHTRIGMKAWDDRVLVLLLRIHCVQMRAGPPRLTPSGCERWGCMLPGIVLAIRAIDLFEEG